MYFLTLFNVEVDSVARYWISLIVEDESSIHDGLRMAVGRIMGMFNANDGIIGLRYPEWLQRTINILIGLF